MSSAFPNAFYQTPQEPRYRVMRLEQHRGCWIWIPVTGYSTAYTAAAGVRAWFNPHRPERLQVEREGEDLNAGRVP